MVGLAAAFILHVALFAVLIFRPPTPPVAMPMPERVTVSLAEDVGLNSAGPEIVAESRAAQAPEFAEVPAPPVSEPVPAPLPEPIPTSAPKPEPQPKPRAETRPKPKPKPKPEATRAATRTETRERRRPDRDTARTSTSRSTTSRDTQSKANTSQTAQTTQPRSGASKVGSDFLAGAGSSTTSTDTRLPANQIGASAKASLLQAISRQLKPNWSAPDGADSDKLYTLVSWQLDESGNLRGSPTCKPTQGVNDTNRTQAERHCDFAIRAVRRSAPFKLPDEYYNAWKSIRDFKFSGTL